jgi:dTDP-4-dehydrorhamnose 3,5-epimerase
MRCKPTALAGVYLIEMEKKVDHRGYFARVWSEREFRETDLAADMVEANVGISRTKGTLRGVHFQVFPMEEVKLIRCPRGRIFDVAVDLRPSSPTHKKWVGYELTAENGAMLYIPAGVGHAYQTLEDDSEMMYLTSQFYAPDCARGVRYNDDAFKIQWPLPISAISKADLTWPDYK